MDWGLLAVCALMMVPVALVGWVVFIATCSVLQAITSWMDECDKERRVDNVIVEIITSDRWYGCTRYRLCVPVEVLGHRVPAGFITDGASVPRFLSVLAGALALLCHFLSCSWGVVLFVSVAVAVLYFPPVGRYLIAAIVHDWLLTQVARKIADREFLRVMEWLGIRWWRRQIMYLAVRGYSIAKFLLGALRGGVSFVKTSM